ncbi:hypothetical protein LCGC14_1618270, partial [marine sediment metagenome]
IILVLFSAFLGSLITYGLFQVEQKWNEDILFSYNDGQINAVLTFLDEAIVYVRIFEKDEVITTRARPQFQKKDFHS